MAWIQKRQDVCTTSSNAPVRARNIQMPVTIGDVKIAPGDYLVGDRDGLIRVPQELVGEVVEKAEAAMATESLVRKAILAGTDPQPTADGRLNFRGAKLGPPHYINVSGGKGRAALTSTRRVHHAHRPVPERASMKSMSRNLFAVLAAVTVATVSGGSFAASVIKVTLFDQGASATMATDLGMTMGGDKSKAVMKIAALPEFAKAGEVTFQVSNNSRDFVHEMLVVKVDDKTKPLPFLASENKVDEDKAGSLGEVSELDPGKTGSLSLTLQPGTYMLFCNLPGHYAGGMWTLVTVK